VPHPSRFCLGDFPRAVRQRISRRREILSATQPPPTTGKRHPIWSDSHIPSLALGRKIKQVTAHYRRYVARHTRNMYTSNKKSDNLSNDDKPLVPLAFQGDSRRALHGFPAGVRQDLGYALYQLQLGQTPPDRKPVRTVGPGVYELREQDAEKWYRVLYVREGGTIHVLHCFEKRSNAIEQKDIETARTRLKRLLEAKREEKKLAKQALRRR
jgi:phage-related protein